MGIVYGQSTDGGLFASVEAMKRADTKAQALFDACFKILSPPDAPKVTIQELNNKYHPGNKFTHLKLKFIPWFKFIAATNSN